MSRKSNPLWYKKGEFDSVEEKEEYIAERTKNHLKAYPRSIRRKVSAGIPYGEVVRAYLRMIRVKMAK